MTETEAPINLCESLIEKIARVDKEVNGPIPDDPWEAYVRGIEAGLLTGATAVMVTLGE